MKILRTAVAVIVVSAIAGCAATPERRSFKENYRDSVITTKVNWRMNRDKLVDAQNISARAWRGEVTLTGRASTEQEKARAGEIALATKNVKEVKNLIEVAEPSVRENIVFQKPVGKFAAPKEIKLPAIDREKAVVAKPAEAKEAREAIVEEELGDSPGEEVVKATTEPETKAPVKLATKSKTKTSAPAKVRQNGVSYEIGKDMARVDDTSDITLQAQQELKELRARKGK